MENLAIRDIRIKIREIESILKCLEKNKQCEHVFIKEIPDGPRDNGEFYYRCTYCGFQK